jgi:hypothetical protein
MCAMFFEQSRTYAEIAAATGIDIERVRDILDGVASGILKKPW